jgi:hypothetical protein
VHKDLLVLVVPEVGRYAIRGGTSITIDPEDETPEKNVRLFLLGSAFGALLHQRGLLPLHANAIEIGGEAVAFMGESGAGKSTLAAWFHDHGYRVIADDVCVVRFNDQGKPVVSPGLRRLRLWQSALLATGRETSDYARSYLGDEQFDKYDVPLPLDSGPSTGLSLQAVYLLKRGESFRISRLSGLGATDAVFANTYRGAYLVAAQTAPMHWAHSVNLVRTTPIYECERVWDSGKLEEQATALVKHVHASRGSNRF